MNSISNIAYSGSSIFDAPSNDPQLAVDHALQDIDGIAARFLENKDSLDGIVLLNEIEGLRRFVLVRSTLAKTLSRPRRRNAPPLGRQLCEALHGMIGDVPSLVKASTKNGEYRMERDTHRAIACLNFLGSLDPHFI